MEKNEKHILILSDFVGYGNVAMATSRGVLTKMGHRVYCLPTALISNTWNFGPCAQLDTTGYLKEALNTWQQLGFPLDGVLLGYIAGPEQAEFLLRQCDTWHRAGVTLFLDPIFADNGKLYHGITPERLDFLRQLLPLVDYALPNFSEVQFLTGAQEPLDALAELQRLGLRHPVITGAPWEHGRAVLLAQGEERLALPYTPIPGNFPGAGDAFSALFTGGILSGLSPQDSAREAIQTTGKWLERSLREDWKGMGLPVERYF